MADLRKKNGRVDPWNMKFWGIGNESWGCGGNMTPEFYADNYRRYATYVRSYGDKRLYKIACGPNMDNYNLNRVISFIPRRYNRSNRSRDIYPRSPKSFPHNSRHRWSMTAGFRSSTLPRLR
jgi:hypothetical protein